MTGIGLGVYALTKQPEFVGFYGFLGASILAVGTKGAKYFQRRHDRSNQETDLSSVENELENLDQREEELDLEYMSLLEEDQDTEYKEN